MYRWQWLSTMVFAAASPCLAEPKLLAEQHAQCLRDNADSYLADESRPVFMIALSGCGTTAAADLSDQSVASSGTELGGIARGTGENIVVLQRSDLECLRDRFDTAVTDIDPTGDGVVEMNLAACD